MTVALILLAFIVGGGAILYLHGRLTRQATTDRETESSTESEPDVETECCGLHITCEKDSLVAGMDAEILYYEDEELDRFRGRPADGYEPAEIEEFREVLLTLRAEEIAGWARSIASRGITLPAEVRDELLMIVAEARQNR